MRTALPLVLSAMLAGCVSNPEYNAPDLIEAVSASDKFVRAVAPTERPADLGLRWWTTVGGSELDELVEALLDGSPSLEAARARVAQSRALSRQALANRLPSVSGSVDAGELALLDPISTPFMQSSTYSLSAAWNLDIFGRLRAAERAARLRETASALAETDLQRSLIAELCRAYVTARALKQRIEITRGLAASFENTATLTDDRYRLGSRTIGALDVQIARQNAYSAAADVPALEANFLIQVQAIDALLGRLPGTTQLSFDEAASAAALPDLSIGSPADLLISRPDVAVAEAQFRAGLADLGVARADLLPSFTLTTALTQSTSPANVLGAQTLIATYAGQIVAPIFEGGRRRAEVRRAKAATEELAADFAAAAISALNEVETALVQQGSTAEELTLRTASLNAAVLSDQIATERYAAGQVSLITLLETRRSLDAARQSAVSAEEARLLAFVALHESLGGQWFANDDSSQERTDNVG